MMQAVQIVQGTAVPRDRSDVDTDQIIPAEWLKRVERTGFGQGLFSSWRDDRSFVLNDERFAGATILIGGPNFGTGSSREHAVRSEEHTSELQSLMRISYAVFCLKKKKKNRSKSAMSQ